MKTWFVFVAMAAALALTCAAHAYPTLNGPTGLGVLPNTKVVGNGAVDVSANFYNLDSGVLGVDSTYPLHITYGLAPNVELGGSYFLVQNHNMWGVNAKYSNLVKAGPFNLGLGAQYIEGIDDDITMTQYYAVGDIKILDGKENGPSIDLTLGANWTQLDYLFMGLVSMKPDAFRYFAGIDIKVAKGISLVADYQTNDTDLIFDTDPMYSVAARCALTPSLTAQAGYTNSLGVLGTADANYFIGLNYYFAPSAK